jgi:tripartite-type tricarboxylate transporter receptor subunit TctC
MVKQSVRVLAAGVSFLLAAATSTLADDYPSRPIEVIVGFPAGSAVDTNIRTILPALQKILKVPIVVDNRPGAGGAVGFNAVAKAKPDGYTLGSVNYPAVSGIYATGGMAFDPLEKFTFLGNMIYEPNVISVAKASPYKDLKEMVAYLKDHQSGLSYGATGVASLDGLTALAVGNAAGAKFRVVNFEGSPDAVSALLGGHIDAMGMSVSEIVPYMKDGSMRPMGVGGDERNPLLPDVPTFKEQGIPLAVNGSSRGFIMPAGADPAIVAKLRDALKTAAADPEYLDAAKKLSQAVHYIPGDQVAATVKQQIEFIKTVFPK